MRLSHELFRVFSFFLFFFSLQAILLHLLARSLSLFFTFPGALLSVIVSLSLFLPLSSKNADFTFLSSSCLCPCSILTMRSNIIKLWYIHIMHRSIFYTQAQLFLKVSWATANYFWSSFRWHKPRKRRNNQRGLSGSAGAREAVLYFFFLLMLWQPIILSESLLMNDMSLIVFFLPTNIPSVQWWFGILSCENHVADLVQYIRIIVVCQLNLKQNMN